MRKWPKNENGEESWAEAVGGAAAFTEETAEERVSYLATASWQGKEEGQAQISLVTSGSRIETQGLLQATSEAGKPGSLLKDPWDGLKQNDVE